MFDQKILERIQTKYVDLSTYFEKIKEMKADYTVVMPTLYELASQDSYREFISETGILLRIDKIAEQYMLGVMPTIMICDFILIYGKRISELLMTIEDAICERVSYTKDRVHLDLLKAITIHVFGRTGRDNMIDSDFHIKSEHFMEMKDLRKLSYAVNGYLKENFLTVNVFSEQLQKDLHLNAKDPNRMFYRNNGHLELVHTKYEESSCQLTACVLFGKIDLEQFDAMCRRVAICCKEYPNISDILQQSMFEPKIKLLSFLYAMVALADFVREKVDSIVLEHVFMNSNFMKVAAAIDPSISYEIYCLFGRMSFKPAFCKQLRDEVSCKETYLPKSDHYVRLIPSLTSFTEDIAYTLGINLESNLYRGLTEYDFEPEMESINLKEYFNLLNQQDYGQVTGIADLLSMLEKNLITIELKPDDETHALKYVIEPVEHSTCIIPNRFPEFIPAFTYLENIDESGKLINGFINYLYLNHPGSEQMDKLKESQPLMTSVYHVGQKYSEWSFIEKGDNVKQKLYVKEAEKYAKIAMTG